MLAPLGRAKRRVGTSLQSNALRGDGTLSAIGAFLAALALAGLLANRYLGWWWADRAAALLAACIAAAEAARSSAPGRATSTDAAGAATGAADWVLHAHDRDRHRHLAAIGSST